MGAVCSKDDNPLLIEENKSLKKTIYDNETQIKSFLNIYNYKI